MRPRSRTAQLDEISALAVTESVCPFCIHSNWPAAVTERIDGLLQGFWGGDDRWHALGRRGQQLRFLIKIRLGQGYFGQGLRELRVGSLRREGIITTPAGSGGRPANVQSSSAQAAR